MIADVLALIVYHLSVSPAAVTAVLFVLLVGLLGHEP
jgi:hypothetical protein